ncbi:MAG: 30S ribosomal protein S12 methylthiotransferase RimO [Oscillospiraceae bacterium]|nr:30S ribosomal protein S12 methylthiotransferase RimO [Oscillospiraceae bacterium]
MANKKIYFISLGCDKNRVDAEMLCYRLVEAGYEITSDIDEADIAIVNTCGFIASSKKEGLDNIYDMVNEKNSGNIQGIIVTGCLSERHGEEMHELIPEIDAIVGIGQNEDIVTIVEGVLQGNEHSFERCPLSLPLEGKRLISTPQHYAYLKIAEGCDNHCTYCAIPSIRGKYRSRAEQAILDEARELVSYGVREIILVAQDTTNYGKDLDNGENLSRLLKKLSEIPGLWRIRILYAYPEKITEELIETISSIDVIAKYLDIPLQHADPHVLKRMGRVGSGKEYLELIHMLRDRIPGITLRSTFIAGFPGETEEEFEHLLSFLSEAKLDRVGCFPYSDEEGTPAGRMKEQLPEEVREERAERVYRLQSEIEEKKQREMVGTVLSVICDGYREDENGFICRSDMDVPEDDLHVLVPITADLIPGEVYFVTVTAVNGMILLAELTDSI